MPKKQLSYDDHQQLGSILRVMHDTLNSIFCNLQNKGGITQMHKPARSIENADRNIFKARDEIENMLYRDFPKPTFDRHNIYGGPASEADLQVFQNFFHSRCLKNRIDLEATYERWLETTKATLMDGIESHVEGWIKLIEGDSGKKQDVIDLLRTGIEQVFSDHKKLWQ